MGLKYNSFFQCFEKFRQKLSAWKNEFKKQINVKKRKASKMRIIRTILSKNKMQFDYETGTKLPFAIFTIRNLCAIVLFTSDEILCNAFQKDMRSSRVGCKWRCMGQFEFQVRPLFKLMVFTFI